MKINTLFLVVLLFVLSQCQQTAKPGLTKNEMIKIVKSLDEQFSEGVQKKDSALLISIYTDSAQYVQPDRKILRGKTEIGQDWADFIQMKENPVDIILNVETVSGSREILYETGNGYTLLADSTKWWFNYVNVWRLQSSGDYKLEVDVYTPFHTIED